MNTTLDEIITKLAEMEVTCTDVVVRFELLFTFFEAYGSTSWVKQKIPENIPYAESLISGFGADFVVECDGKEFPVHSLVLKGENA